VLCGSTHTLRGLQKQKENMGKKICKNEPTLIFQTIGTKHLREFAREFAMLNKNPKHHIVFSTFLVFLVVWRSLNTE
jgi:hypothetical protein